MKTLHIRREHQLGLPVARRLGAQWANKAEEKLGLSCEVTEGEDHDVVHFTRSGVDGHLHVAADHVEVVAKLGMMMAPFAGMLEQQIGEQLDRMLARSRGEPGEDQA